MFRLFAFLTVTTFSFSQTLPALRWVQQIDALGADQFSGLGTDAQGNIYVAGNTTSTAFPVKSAVQSNLGSAGLFKIDGSGYARLGQSAVVQALAADPANPNVFFAASSGLGGVKSSDGGNTWTAMPIPTKQVVQFAVDPANDQNVYAAAFDVGLLKSADGGATWKLINNGLTACTDCSLPKGYFGARNIWVDPNTSAVFAYFGASLVRSGDGGATWQPIGPTAGGFSVYFETPKPGVVYMFPARFGPLKSIDDGVTFQGIDIPVTSIFADPNQPGRLLGNGTGGIFESDDDGVTWTMKLANRTILAADFANRALYGANTTVGIVQISSDLKTVTPIGPPGVSATGLIVSSGHVYVPNSGGHNVFVTKLDPTGNVIYSTYFGGSGDDPATGMAVDAAGNVYVAGNNSSLDFPSTKGAYAAAGNVFLFKLNPDGSLGYSTLFPAGNSTAAGIAVDRTGSVYLTGETNGGLPTTPGAYQTKCGCAVIPSLFLTIFESDSFVTKFDPTASTLVYSTYMGVATSFGKLLAVAPDGSAYLAAGAQYSPSSIYHLDAAGASLLGSQSTVIISGMALAPDGSVYVAGYPPANKFQPTAGAFQTTAPNNSLPAQGASATAIVKFDAQLKNVLAATYFGGPYGPLINSLAIDASGNIYIAGSTAPHGLPTRTQLFGAFGPVNGGSGFVSELSGDLSALLFSTYLGDAEPFEALGVVAVSTGSVVVAGQTTIPSNPIQNGNIYLNGLTLAAPPPLRIDAIKNAASMLDGPLSVGETIVIRGAGFGSDAQLMIGDAVVPALASNATQITAVVPAGLPTTPVIVQVQSAGATSNQVLVPVASASPGLFSADGTGSGPGYILNQDGTLNSPTNPAAMGDRITIFATGVGPVSFTDGFAVTALPGGVFVDGFYCNGVAAVMGPVGGLPGSVYQLTVFIPKLADLVANNPDLKNFVFPPLVSLIFQIGGASTQIGLSISIGPSK
jgi:uncharacterized protein (TIGR03437 family)